MSIEATDDFMRSTNKAVTPTVAAARANDLETPFPAEMRAQTEKLK
jgi:hypothetical protein